MEGGHAIERQFACCTTTTMDWTDMPKVIDRHETNTTEDEYDLSDLDLSALSVISMHGPAAKPEREATASWPPSCCCYPA